VSTKRDLEEIKLSLAGLTAAIVVREPGSAKSAESYDGLRKQLTLGMKNHRAHISHLLSLADSLERGVDLQFIKQRVADYLSELGVESSYDISEGEEYFEIEGGEGTGLECIEPCFIERLEDGTVGIVIRKGKAKRILEPEVVKPDEQDVVEITNENADQSNSADVPIGRKVRRHRKRILKIVLYGMGTLVVLTFIVLIAMNIGGEKEPGTSTSTTSTSTTSTSTTSTSTTSTSTPVSNS